MEFGQPSDSEFETEKGIRFIEQWERAIEADPQFVLVTQWNEWIAQRFITGEDGGSQQQGKITIQRMENLILSTFILLSIQGISPYEEYGRQKVTEITTTICLQIT